MKQSNLGTLYIVATPIGNMGDITLRAIETLKSVDLVVCEDTRVTGSLLHKLEIKKPMRVLHQHSEDKVISELVDRLIGGESIACVTDGGTPGISDPGNYLVKKVQETNLQIQKSCHSGFSPESIGSNATATGEVPQVVGDSCLHRNDEKIGDGNEYRGSKFQQQLNNRAMEQLIPIIPIPGPSAVTSAISVSGMVEKEFYFAGFLPKKKGRQTWLKNASLLNCPIVIYESAFRIEKTLLDLKQFLGENCEVFLAREMTKMFEEYWGGNIVEIIYDLKNHKIKGEFVLLVKKGK